MKMTYSFRRRNWSNFLVDYAKKKGEKIKKYETHKNFLVHVIFTDDRYRRLVDLHLEREEGEVLTSHAETDDYFEAMNIVFNEVIQQLEKIKIKTKSQKKRQSRNKKVVEEDTSSIEEERKAA